GGGRRIGRPWARSRLRVGYRLSSSAAPAPRRARALSDQIDLLSGQSIRVRSALCAPWANPLPAARATASLHVARLRRFTTMLIVLFQSVKCETRLMDC